MWSSVPVIDRRDKVVRAAYAAPGLEHPVRLAISASQMLVAQADARVTVVERPVLLR